MADPIVPLLREMRAKNGSLQEQTQGMIAILERRFGTLEEAQNSYRQAPTADALLSKPVTGEFEERIETLERKVREPEGRK